MDVYEVVADGTRRHILELVAVEERTAGWLASQFAMSGPGVSKHLRILRDSGLLTYRQVGQKRLYGLTPEPLNEVVSWIDEMTTRWSTRLDALEQHLDAQSEPNTDGKAER